MKNLTKRYINIFMILCSLSVHTISFATVTRAQFIDALKKLRTEVIRSEDTSDNLLKERYSQCKKIVNDAIIKTSQYEGTLTDQHLESIQQLTNILIETKERSLEGRREIAALLLKDLTLKFKDNKENNLATVISNKLPKVTVRAVKENTPVNNLTVNWSPLILYSKDNPVGSFGLPTSPAVDNMMPGVYVFWLVKGVDKTVISERQFEVDPSKENELVLVIN
jgi:hypothetical protein